MERGEAAVGHRPTGVCERHVECHRFCNEFAVCGDGGIACSVLFSGEPGVERLDVDIPRCRVVEVGLHSCIGTVQ